MDPAHWWPFFAASWLISLSPGAGAVTAMGAGLAHGFARGYWATVGLVAGIWTQVLVVGIGLGAVVASTAWAFALIKWLGVAYLIWLGVQAWRAPAVALKRDEASVGVPSRRRALVARGWAVNAVNPKGTVFLLAVVPQFLDPWAPLLPQYAVIALTLGFTDLVVMAGYTALAARVLGALRSAQAVRRVNQLFGGLFVLAGLALAGFRRGA